MTRAILSCMSAGTDLLPGEVVDLGVLIVGMFVWS